SLWARLVDWYPRGRCFDGRNAAAYGGTAEVSLALVLLRPKYHCEPTLLQNASRVGFRLQGDSCAHVDDFADGACRICGIRGRVAAIVSQAHTLSWNCCP